MATHIPWLPKNYSLDLQDKNVITLHAKYAPFTFLTLIPSPSLGEFGRDKQEPLLAGKRGINSLHI